LNKILRHLKLLTGTLFLFILILPLLYSYSQNTDNNSLSSHWVPSWGYRDELNPNDTDHQNFWSDNAGKILTMAAITGDSIDVARSLSFIQNHTMNGGYMPETVVNSSLFSSGNSITNRIVTISAQNGSDLESLSVGNYYAGVANSGYIGSDRLYLNGFIYRANSSVVYKIHQNEFVKRSLFQINSKDYYVYLNATINVGEPYVSLSLQILPVSTDFSSTDWLYLQAFDSSANQFTNGSLYDQHGQFIKQLSINNGNSSPQNGTLMVYSKENVFSQDALAISFSNSTAQIGDLEYWYNNGPFNGLSWTGVGFKSQVVSAGKLSQPIYAKIYPLQHLDYRLINDTASYLATNPHDTALTSPVSFGFIAYGLALAAKSNASLANEAKEFWNFYFSRYSNQPDYPSSYSRAIDTFALAGLEIYGCNSTVEAFVRNYLSHASGTSIEENGWGALASDRLSACTGLAKDASMYRSYVGSIVLNASSYVFSDGAIPPTSTYQFGETASALMLAGVPYNSPVVLALMNAVFQSNVNGTVLNTPNHGDWANTETLPAYILSTWLFENAMKNQTGGYSITGLTNVNLTSIDSDNGVVLIGSSANDGTLYFSNPSGSTYQIRSMNGFNSTAITPEPTTTLTSTVYETPTTTQSTVTVGTTHDSVSTETSVLTSSHIITMTITYTLTTGSSTTNIAILAASVIFLACGGTAFGMRHRMKK
jgi:hypothetical protein